MQPLSSSACLALWERGRRLHSLDRGLLALSFAVPEVQAESIADWPLGRRNQALLELICCCFGSRLEAWSSCALCGEKMELELDATELLAERGDEAARTSTVVVQDRVYRLPSSRDLAWVARENEFGTAALRLVERCQVSAAGPLALSLEELTEIEERMADADPLAEIRIALRCPTCSREWDEPLDVTEFLWRDVESRGKLLLGEVHMLASAYGWTEGEILSLGDARRSLYLDMVQGLDHGMRVGVSRAAERRTLSLMVPEMIAEPVQG